MKSAIPTLFALLSAIPLITAEKLKQDLTLSFLSEWPDAKYTWLTSAPLSYDKDKVGENRSVEGKDWPYLGDWMKYSEEDHVGKQFGVQRGEWGQICNVTVDKDPGTNQAYIKMYDEGDKKKIVSDHEEQGVHVKCEDGDVSKLDTGDGDTGDGNTGDEDTGDGVEENDDLAQLFAAMAPAFTGSGQTPPWEVTTAGPETSVALSTPTSSFADTTTSPGPTAKRRRGVRGFRG